MVSAGSAVPRCIDMVALRLQQQVDFAPGERWCLCLHPVQNLELLIFVGAVLQDAWANLTTVLLPLHWNHYCFDVVVSGGGAC